MDLLISGGNHVLQGSIADQLTAAGHSIRIVRCGSRPPSTTLVAQGAPRMVDGSTAATLAAALHGCDAAIAIDGSIAAPSGTGADACPGPLQLMEAAAATRLRRLIVVASPAAAASMGEPGGETPDLLLRCAPVYGLGTDPISRFLIMMRSLPAVPVLNDRHVMRPVWHEDLAAALVEALADGDGRGRQTLDIMGPDAITYDQLYERLSALTDRRPLRIPVPEFMTTYGGRLARAFGMDVPFDPAPGDEGGWSDESAVAAGNAGAVRVQPTTLDEGLRRLVLELDETIPSEGVGSVQVKRFHTTIRGSAYSPTELLSLFRQRFADVMPSPVGVEPVAPGTTLVPDGVLTLALPGRGHVQVRVEDVQPDRVVLGTVQGHLIAGVVSFSVAPEADGVRFEVTTCDNASNALDWLALSMGGAKAQDANWWRVVHIVGKLAGGQAVAVQTDVRTLNAAVAAAADRWIARLVSGGA
jgi:NADH dehydrogenase